MSSVRSVFLRLYQQHRFLRTSATVNVLRTQCSCRNASSSTILSSEQTLQLNPTGPENHDPVLISLLKSCGFSDARIAEIVAKDPEVVKSKVGSKTLKPKQTSRNAVVSSTKQTPVAKEPRILKSKVYRNASRSTISSPIKTVRKLNPAGSENNESVVRSFFKSYGFSDAHIAKLVAKDPGFLKSRVDKTFKPKLDFLAEHGVSGSLLHELIVDKPGILKRSLDDHLKPTLSLLQTCLGSKGKVVTAVKRCSYSLSYGNRLTMEGNINLLVSEGVPMEVISKLIYVKPRLIMYQDGRMLHAVKSAKRFGFRPDDPTFVYALDTILTSGPAFCKKNELFKNLLGLSEEEVNSMFKRNPRCFIYSEDKIKKAVNFFVNTMQAEPSILFDNPDFFSRSVDNTLVPRYKVFKILETKKLLKEGRKFTGAIKKSEKWFESNYVVKYLAQVPELMEIYQGFSKTSNTTVSNENNESAVFKSKVDKTSCATISSPKKTLQKFNPTSSENHESVVLSFFKSYGFSDAHVAKVVAKEPLILRSDVHTTFKPKLDRLADNGISGSFLHELIVADPCILCRSLDAHLQPTLSLLRTCLGSNEKVVKVVKRSSLFLSYGSGLTLEDNFNFLVSEGVPMKSISKLISVKPRLIMCRADRMVHAVKSAKQFGFRLDDPLLHYAIDGINSMSESTICKKNELFKNLLGLSEEEVNSMFKRNPRCFVYSEDKIKKVVDFFVNTMQAEPSILFDNPVFFSYSVDNTLVPRYKVFKILETKKLLKEGRKFTGAIKQSTKWFESNYVVKYLDQVPDLMEVYHGLSKTSNTPSVINTATT